MNEKMMFCNKCGNQVPESTEICNKCGSRIAKLSEITATEGQKKTRPQKALREAGYAFIAGGVTNLFNYFTNFGDIDGWLRAYGGSAMRGAWEFFYQSGLVFGIIAIIVGGLCVALCGKTDKAGVLQIVAGVSGAAGVFLAIAWFSSGVFSYLSIWFALIWLYAIACSLYLLWCAVRNRAALGMEGSSLKQPALAFVLPLVVLLGIWGVTGLTDDTTETADLQASRPNMEERQGAEETSTSQQSPADAAELSEYELQAAVFADLDLPLVVRNNVFIGWTRHSQGYISQDGVFHRAYSVQNNVYELRPFVSNVRSFSRAPHGDEAIFYITYDNELWGFGSNSNGLIGDGTGVDVSAENPVLILENVAITHHCGTFRQAIHAIQTDRTLWTWGSGVFSPERIAENVVRFIEFNGNDMTTLVQTGTGGIYNVSRDGVKTRIIAEPVIYLLYINTRWNGYNAVFINAENILIRRDKRGEVVEDEEIATDVVRVFRANSEGVSNSRSNLLFITADSTLWGIGNNTEGELGDGTRAPRTTPVQIAQDVIYARAYGFLRADGSLWTWYNDNPTPRQTYENVAYEGFSAVFRDNRRNDNLRHYRDGRVFFQVTHMWTPIHYENVALPSYITFD